MKLNVILFIFFILSISTLKSQEFGGGIIAGFTGSAILGDQLTGLKKPGLQIGGFADLKFSESSSFQLELNFIQKGSRSLADSANQANYGESYLLRLNYVEMPFIYKYRINKIISAEGGISYAVLINSYEKTNGVVHDSNPPFEQGDLSGNVGLYYHWSEKADINIRFSHSILPIRPHYGGGTHNLNRGQYNEVLSVTLRYRL